MLRLCQRVSKVSLHLNLSFPVSPLPHLDSAVQEPSDPLFLDEAFGPRGILLQSSCICPTSLKTVTTKHIGCVGQKKAVSGLSCTLDWQEQAFPGKGHRFNAGIGEILPPNGLGGSHNKFLPVGLERSFGYPLYTGTSSEKAQLPINILELRVIQCSL